MNKEKRKVTVFLDSVNRTIIAEPVSHTQDTICMKNPAIASISFDQTGKMALQLFPVFFRELLVDKNHETVFEFIRDSITTSNIETEFSVDEHGVVTCQGGIENGIIQQYVKLFADMPTTEPIKE